MKFALRLFTLICYFLPFTFFLVTCNGLTGGIAYNQKEADSLRLNYRETTTTAVYENSDDSIRINSDTLKNTPLTTLPASNIYNDSSQNDEETKQGNFWYKLLWKILMPTTSSLSGVGCIFNFKNLIGQIVVAISLLISLILLAAYKFLKLKKVKQYLLLANITCILIFIADSFISEVSLLWGLWLLLFLLAIQLKLEFHKANNAGLPK